MRLGLLLATLGRFLRFLPLAMLPSLLLALLDGDGRIAAGFAGTAVGVWAVGAVLGRGARRLVPFHRSEALVLVAASWLVAAVAGAVPFVADGLPPVDALFESMSGFTTTGATVLTDFGAHGRAFYLWRAVTQWLGGLGVIALFVLVFPNLGIGGRQLFFTEASSAPGEGVHPQVRRTAQRLWVLYGALTLLMTVVLVGTGFAPYDAVVHALATMSAGGYSPHPQSVMGYGNPAAEWAFVPFMLAAGTSFPLLWKALTGRPGSLLGDVEFRAYLGFVLLAVAVVAGLHAEGVPDEADLRAAAFQVTSLVSSTGFASENYDLWSDAARVVLMAVLVVCACAGSAGGGPKIVRLWILGRFLRRELTQAVHPRAVIPLTYRGRPVASQTLRSVVAVVVLFGLGYVVVGTAVVLMGADLVSGFTAAVACLNNVGPGLGTVGPMGSYATLPDASKLVLTLAMWAGRLEIVTVLALLHPDVWRNARWRRETTHGLSSGPSAVLPDDGPKRE